MTFTPGENYTRASIRQLLGLPPAKGGAWATGHVRHGGKHFLFCGIDTPGRTGQNYNNRFVGDELVWHPRNDANPTAPVFAELISGHVEVHVFFRSDDREPFTYAGAGKVADVLLGPPIEVRWTFDRVDTPGTPAYYVLGTKYGMPARDMLPLMLANGVVGMGFAHETSLRELVGMESDLAASELRRLLPNESDHARRQLCQFLALKPGDLIALKASGSPLGDQARLVIARYAIVSGDTATRYEHVEPLGHTIAVDFLSEMSPVVLPLGYGRTLHRIADRERIKEIFGAYAEAEAMPKVPTAAGGVLTKATHTSQVAARGAYLMNRIHNQLQIRLYELLQAKYGSAVRLEEDSIDIAVHLPGLLLLVEVKSSLSPIYCVREALGQMLHYAYRANHLSSSVRFLVVGPSAAKADDAHFVNHVRATTGLDLFYCTPDTYADIQH